MSHKRKSNKRNRSVRQRLLILCEGETERNYFLAMRENANFKVKMAATSIDIAAAKNSTPEQVVKEALKREAEAKRENNAYEKVWIVFDHDNHTHRKQAYEDANKENFGVAFSSICFENWYLLHFVKTAKAFANGDKLVAELKKCYPNYEKAKQNDFENLKDNLENAMNNAAWQRTQMEDEGQHITENNPWTDVDKLMVFLQNL
jgi:hypothetical protein